MDDNDELELLKDLETLRRVKEIHSLNTEDKNHILTTLDALLRDAKTRSTYNGNNR
jgi:hypothetical protein